VQARDHCRALSGPPGEQIEHVELMLRIEVVGRFVEQEQGRLLCQHLRDGQATAFAA